MSYGYSLEAGEFGKQTHGKTPMERALTQPYEGSVFSLWNMVVLTHEMRSMCRLLSEEDLVCHTIPWGKSRVVPCADHSTDQDRDVAKMVQ